MASSRSPSPSLPRSRSVSPTTATTRLILQNRLDALSDSSSEEDDAILRPRGKIAAQMQARSRETPESSDDDTNPTRSTSPPQNSSGASGQAGAEDEDEDVIMVRPRKLKSRREPTPSREPAPQEAAPSPGLFISPQQKSAPASPGLFVSPSKPRSPAADQSDEDLPSPTRLTKNPRFQALVAKKRQERLAREAEEARKKAERRKAAGLDEDGDDDIAADNDEDDDNDDSIADDEAGHKLTQDAATSRQPRKASKKALEEMNRETQRLTRSLQLAHEARVKKKITKATLFERFNFKPEGAGGAPVDEPAPAASSSRAPTPGSAQQSDAEARDSETPPSSPPAAVGKEVESTGVAPAEAGVVPQGDGLDKGKGKATAADLEEQQQPVTQGPPKKRNIRVNLAAIQASTATKSVSLESGDDDDDDLQVVVTRKSKLDAIFDRVPANKAKQAHSLQILRRLAQLDDPDKQPAPPCSSKLKKQEQQKHQETVMTAAELQATLLQRARQQARLERDRHLEELRARGVYVQTAEERERELQEVEDMVAKARREAEEIMRREREAAKAEKKKKKQEKGEGEGEDEDDDPLSWDDESEDEEYDEAEGVEEKEIELSGSEEEEEGEEEEAEDGGEQEEQEGVALFSGSEEEDGDDEKEEKMVDDAAEEAKDQADGAESDGDADVPSTNQVRRRARKHVAIVSDDEDDAEPLVKATPRPKDHLPKSPSVRNTESPSAPTSVLRSARKTFIPGLPVAGPAGLGLTQIFAGTMDDTPMETTQASPSQPRPTFDVTAFPDSNFSQTAQEATEDTIRDSQPTRDVQQAETQGVQLRFSQSQAHGFDTFLRENPVSQTQTSEIIEPTQDAGFQNFSPLRQRFIEAPASTNGTVPVGQSQAQESNESPLAQRTGKLRRRVDVVPESPTRQPRDGEDQVMEDAEYDEFGFGTTSKSNAFAAMKEAARKEKKRKKKAFDKKKSQAREMVEEQAVESEDEYAGLGGVDGEDSDDSEDAQSVKEMIDDETKDNEEDERKLAAFYADRERAEDEKRVEKLFHDVTTGQLRRKRHADWDDLSDSDDGGEARRRMKRRQFAKMQRALLADERISKVAENPRNQAFLRTIEDRGSDDEDMDFILAPPPAHSSAGQGSQSSSGAAQSTAAVIPNSQPQTVAAPNPRRTKMAKKPSTLSEIRESLSNLLEEPYNSSSLIPATELGVSDGEDDDDNDEDRLRPGSSHSNSSGSSNKENRNPRRGSKPASQVIDRISLKRNASATAASSSSNRLAFATTGSASGSSSSSLSSGGFRVPALLRRATTNSLLSTSSSSSSSSAAAAAAATASTATTTTTTGTTGRPPAESSMKIRKPAGKRSGVSYLARETERRAALAEAERRREARKFRGVESRVKEVGGLFGAGKFE
ncbi:hypothetical protein VTH82DRAFT_5844 [Thermothelomyces myriococcoides]